jgi:hypothetical protein
MRGLCTRNGGGEIRPPEDSWECRYVQVELVEVRVETGRLYKCDLFAYATHGYELREVGCIVASSIQDMAARTVLRSDFELFCTHVSQTMND